MRTDGSNIATGTVGKEWLCGIVPNPFSLLYISKNNYAVPYQLCLTLILTLTIQLRKHAVSTFNINSTLAFIRRESTLGFAVKLSNVKGLY
jgi:hypothetical protein